MYSNPPGKKEATPFRKMGHITVLDENLDDALKKAQKAKEILKVKREYKNIGKPLVGIIMGVIQTYQL